MIRTNVKLPRQIAVGSLLVVGTLVAAVGCDYRRLPVIDDPPSADPTGLGAICSLGTDDLPPTNLSIDTESASCSSRICVRPTEQKTTDTAALCTRSCNNDVDCEGGAARDPQNPMDQHCQTGFTCRAIVPNLTNVSAACQNLCVCRDFLDLSQPATPPAGCS